MTIRNPEIIAKNGEYSSTAARQDVDKATVINDIQDWVEAHQTNNIQCRKLTGVFINGASILMNGRPVVFANIPTFLATEDTLDLISMRDALAAHFNEALASLTKRKVER